MTDSNLVTVSELKVLAPELNLSRYDDPTISGMITAASKMATDYLEYTPYAEEIVNELSNGMITSDGDLLVFFRKPPLIALRNIAITRGTNTVTLSLTGVDQTGAIVTRYNTDYTQRYVRYPYEQVTLQGSPILLNFLSLRGAQFYTTINYRGGFEVGSLPQSIKMAVVMYLRDLFSFQFNTMGADRMMQGSMRIEYLDKSGQSKLIRAAEKLLGPYRRMSA